LRFASGVAPRGKQIKFYPHGQILEPNRPGTFLGQRVLTKDRRVDLAPEIFLKAATKLNSDYEREWAQQNRMKLISKRERLTHNSWMHNSEPFVGPGRSTNYLYVNPADAVSFHLTNGDTAEVTSSFGTVRSPVRITDDLMPGVVAFPHGWGHQDAEGLTIARKYPGVNVNYLTPDGPEGCEKLSGMSHMTGIVVKIRKAK
ncbi:MAG: hypothetical protein FJY85_24670, partial [Deltaproteobacteria bacterium]|nr:hypothetical protein [Deltaproteobacteria bacterium]